MGSWTASFSERCGAIDAPLCKDHCFSTKHQSMSRPTIARLHRILMGLAAAASVVAVQAAVTAERGPNVSPQDFDLENRSCRSQALRVAGLDQQVAIYVDCMQRFGNIMHTADGRVIPNQRAKRDNVTPTGPTAPTAAPSTATSDAEQIEAMVDAQARAKSLQPAAAATAVVASAPGVSDRAASEYEAGVKAWSDKDGLIANSHFLSAMKYGDVRAVTPWCEIRGPMSTAAADQCVRSGLGIALKRQPTSAEVQASLASLSADLDAKAAQSTGTLQTVPMSQADRDAAAEALWAKRYDRNQWKAATVCPLLTQNEPQPDEAANACAKVMDENGTLLQVRAAIWTINPRNASSVRHFTCQTDATKQANKNAGVALQLEPNPYGARLTTAYLVPLKSGQNYICPITLVDGLKDVVVRLMSQSELRKATDTGGLLGGLSALAMNNLCSLNPDGLTVGVEDVRQLTVHISDDSVEYGFGEGKNLLTGTVPGVTYKLNFKSGVLTRNGNRYGVCRPDK